MSDNDDNGGFPFKPIAGWWHLSDNPYGFCPICGTKGVLREDAVDGRDACRAGHIYQSRDAKKHP